MKAPMEKNVKSFHKNDATPSTQMGTDSGTSHPTTGYGGAVKRTAYVKSGKESKMPVSDRTAGAKEAQRTYLGTNTSGVTMIPSPSAAPRDGYKK